MEPDFRLPPGDKSLNLRGPSVVERGEGVRRPDAGRVREPLP
jgi:hypothetical protein